MTPTGEKNTNSIQVTNVILNCQRMGLNNYLRLWVLGALYNEWKKIKGYDKYDAKENTGQCQSSFKDFETSIKSGT